MAFIDRQPKDHAQSIQVALELKALAVISAYRNRTDHLGQLLSCGERKEAGGHLHLFQEGKFHCLPECFSMGSQAPSFYENVGIAPAAQPRLTRPWPSLLLLSYRLGA